VGKGAAVVIPAEIQGFPVREIGGAFRNTSLASVIIPEGVTAIRAAAQALK
jgi:hypothetical protein